MKSVIEKTLSKLNESLKGKKIITSKKSKVQKKALTESVMESEFVKQILKSSDSKLKQGIVKVMSEAKCKKPKKK